MKWECWESQSSARKCKCMVSSGCMDALKQVLQANQTWESKFSQKPARKSRINYCKNYSRANWAIKLNKIVSLAQISSNC